ELVEKVESRGGLISWKNNSDGSRSPYELNITLVSALSEPNDESLGVERFLCSQAVALAMKGIPAVYIHSITGTPNYKDGVEATGRNRTINRRKWQEEEFLHILEDRESMQATIFYRYSDMLRRRSEHLAFHPSSRQEILSLNDMVFGFIREDLTSGERITCLFNFSASEQSVKSSAVGGNISRVDLLTGSKIEAGEDIPLRPYQALWLLQN
ncbi:MAG: sugar phosphorylase, partial [Opitutae bacterium]